MHRRAIAALMLAGAIAGCSSGGNGVSTASILGNAPTPPTAGGATPVAQPVAAAPAAPVSTPTDRALQVGTVSARAVKCGYNFDPAKLKASYIAYETGLGTSNEQIAQIEKIYGVGYNGVMKAAATEANYCSERKTEQIKEDLNRLLAGNFEPPRTAVAQKKDDDDGFFGGLFGNSSGDSGPAFGSSDWWDSQADKAR